LRVLVSDTSVLIDLERGGLLETAFALGWELAVPDLLYDRELKETNGAKLRGLGLRIEELPPEAVVSALGYQRRTRAISIADAFALALAKHQGWALLSGDGPLRALAGEEAVACHGVLWTLDRMLENAAAAPQALHDGLTTLSTHPRCRLPAKEVKMRLALYVGLIKAAKREAK